MTTDLPRTRRSHWGLPLLARELHEQSSLRRTYVVRTVYALMLFLSAFLLSHETFHSSTTNPSQVLGQGQEMFSWLVRLQFAGVYFFMPLLTCGVLTHEKERDSLALLLLTRLSPTTILLEKLASRLVVMFSFELMLLPLLGVAYSLGGVSWEQLLLACWFLALATVQMGCLALCCSAYFRTTVQSFIASYVIIALLLVVWPMLFQWQGIQDGWLGTVLGSPEIPGSFGQFAAYGFIALAMYYHASDVTHLSGVFASWTFLFTIPIVVSTVLFFLLARLFIVRRAFVTPHNLALRVFRILDRWFVRLNQNRITRGIVLVPPRTSFPDQEPVLWRETTKSAMGNKRYLFRLVLLLELPVFLFCGLMAPAPKEVHGMVIFPAVLLAGISIACLVICVRAAGMIAGERSQQTLDVLLTTPLAAREILMQKFRSLYRDMLALGVPVATAVAFETVYRWYEPSLPGNGDLLGTSFRFGPSYSFTGLGYLCAMLLTLFVILHFVAWLSFYVGLRSRTRTRAIFSAVAVLAAICILPFVVIILPCRYVFRATTHNQFFLASWLLSPVSFLLFVEIESPFIVAGHALAGLLLNTILYGGAGLLFRWLCLGREASLLKSA